MTAPYPSQSDLHVRSWTSVDIDEPRSSAPTLCGAEVWTAEDVLQIWRAERRRGRELAAAGITKNDALALLVVLREARRRAHFDDDLCAIRLHYPAEVRRLEEAGYSAERRFYPSHKWEIGNGRTADWEAIECFEDEQSRHGKQNFHGVVDPRRRPALIHRDPRNDEPEYLDELRVVPEVTPLFVGDEDESDVAAALISA